MNKYNGAEIRNQYRIKFVFRRNQIVDIYYQNYFKQDMCTLRKKYLE